MIQTRTESDAFETDFEKDKVTLLDQEPKETKPTKPSKLLMAESNVVTVRSHADISLVSQRQSNETASENFLQPSDEDVNATELLLSEKEAVVIGVNNESVKLKIGNDTEANFPRSLFDTNVKYGQPLFYQIRRSSKGYRYQAFVPRSAPSNEAFVKHIKEMLKDIE